MAGIETARILRKNQTQAEVEMWEQLRSKKYLGLKFRRQHPLHGYIVDFYCQSVNLVVEIDGGIHKKQKEKDEYRQQQITAKSGASFIRFTNDEILNDQQNSLKKLAMFITAIRSKPPSPCSPSP